MRSHQDVALTLGHLCVAFTSKACVQSFDNEDTFVDSFVFPVFSGKHPSISREFWPMEPRANKDFRVNDGKSGRNYKLNREELWVEEEKSQKSKNRQVDATKLETKKLTEMEAKIEEKDLEKWRIDVSNAVSGESLGHYFLFPTDLLQDLKGKSAVSTVFRQALECEWSAVASDTCATRGDDAERCRNRGTLWVTIPFSKQRLGRRNPS